MNDNDKLLKRFMDDSDDIYQDPFGDVSNMMDIAIKYNKMRNIHDIRLHLIKRNVTAEEWDILNGTNFTSPVDQISRFANIINRLIHEGMFNDEDKE
jgi:hypothetical protein